MLLCGEASDVFAHIDFGYVAGSRPWFDANLLPIPERFKNCCAAAGRWSDFVNDVGFAFAILQDRRQELCAVASAFAEPLTSTAYPRTSITASGHTRRRMRAMVEAAPGDIAALKNLHHKLSHS